MPKQLLSRGFEFPLLQRITDIVTGPSDPLDSGYHKRQALAIAIALLLIAASAFAVVFGAIGDLVSTYVLLSAPVLAIIIAVVYRRTHNIALAMHLLSLVLFGVICFLSYREGGVTAPALPWLVLIPFELIVAGTYGAALLWLVISSGAVATFFILELNGHAFPKVLGANPSILYALSAMGLFLITFAWLLVVDRHRRFAMSRLSVANQELATARDEAIAAASAKSRFLATMSHELRTPMNGVLGMAELLINSDLGNRQRRYAQTIQSSGEALLSIINDVLDFSRIEAGKLELESTEFDLHELLQQVAEMFAPQAYGKGIDLSYCLDPSVPLQVTADRGRLRQVIINLVNNAVKFTERGEVHIRVSATPHTSDGQCVLLIQVEDTGVGFPEEVKARLFEAFTQADNSTTRRFGGTGLGLSIVRGLIELMHGHIDAQSEIGRGSTFSVRVPVKAGGTRKTQDLPSAGTRVLVLVDAPRQRESILCHLQALGTHATGAADATVAMAALSEAANASRAYQVVITDGSLVQKNRALVQQIQQVARLIVLIPIGNSIEVLGVAPFEQLSKPVRRADLQAALTRALRRPPNTPGLPKPNIQANASKPLARTELRGRVLLADDDPVNQQLIIAMLEYLAVEFDLAADAAEVLRYASARRYDLILMDCESPAINGFQTVQRLRALTQPGTTQAPRMVALVSGGGEDESSECHAAGFDDCLPEPVKLERLLATLSRWLAPQESS